MLYCCTALHLLYLVSYIQGREVLLYLLLQCIRMYGRLVDCTFSPLYTGDYHGLEAFCLIETLLLL